MKFDMAGVSVMLAMPTHRDINPLTVRSLLETQEACIKRGIQLEVQMQVGTSLVHHARTKAADLFLRSECNRLFFIDSDIVWSGDDFIRMVALSTRMECVTAIYTCKVDPPRFCLNVDDPTAVMKTNEFGCLPMQGGGMGLGYTIIQRGVIEELSAKAPLAKFPDIDQPVSYVFRCDIHNGDARGEDMAFFADVRDLGYVVNLDPHVTLGHVGAKEYRASILDHLDHLKQEQP